MTRPSSTPPDNWATSWPPEATRWSTGRPVGMMGALADRVMAAGGEVTGVMPDHLVEREQAHRGLTRLLRVRNMHERKASMAAHSDAFIALPGGIGTLEELFEAWTWQYLGLHDKPIGLLDTQAFTRPC